MAFVRSREAASGTVTQSLTPSKLRPEPALPATRVASRSVPALPLPELSLTVVPAPSSKPYAATSPVGSTVTATGDEVVWLPELSVATALSVCVPAETARASQVIAYGAPASGAPRSVPSSLNWTDVTAASSDASAVTDAFCTTVAPAA